MFKKFLERLNIEPISDVFKPCFDEAYDEFKSKGVFFLEHDYIISVQNKTNTFPNIIEDVLSEAEKVKQDDNASLYALFLYKSMLKRQDFISNFSSFKLLPEYPLFAFLCLVPTIQNTYDVFRQKCLPEDIVESTLATYEESVYYQKCITGKNGLNEGYFSWLQRYVDCRILHIDRLKFEVKPLRDPVYVLQNKTDNSLKIIFDGGKMNKDGLYFNTPPREDISFTAAFSETNDSYFGNEVTSNGKCISEIKEYKKDEYNLVLKKLDTVLSVHISGEKKFTKELCDLSYKRAIDVFNEYFPEHKFKAFHCSSWMLSSELDSILKPTSNIMQFKSDYKTYPVKTKGEDVFNFVFNHKFKTYEEMPENTSLQKAIKQIYLSGGYIYEYGGIILL